MGLPEPEPGLVVCYAYLWRWQQQGGAENGEKGRPAVIVLATGESPDVMVVPVTSQPVDRDAIHLPPKVAAHLGLDVARRSRIVVDEVNLFRWPNDLTSIPGKPPGTFHYGFIPPKLYRRVRDAVMQNYRAGNLAKVKRGS